MVKWIFNQIWPLLEPKLEKLIQDAIAEAVKDISVEVETLPAKIVSNLTAQVPTIGNILKGLF